MERSDNGVVPKVVPADEQTSLAKKKLKKSKPPQIAKRDMKFCPPNNEMLWSSADKVVDDWLAGNAQPQERGKNQRTPSQQPVELADAARLPNVRDAIAEGLKAHVKTMLDGPFMKRVRIHRMLESMAAQLLVQLVRLEPFQAPSEKVLRQQAIEYCRALPNFECMDFEELLPKYCAICLQYDDGSQVVEYVYLALQREVERLRRGRFMQPALLRSRLDAAAKAVFQDVANHILEGARAGIKVGEKHEDGTITVKQHWQTIASGNCDAFLVILQDEDDAQSPVSVLDIRTTRRPNGTTAAQHARAKKPPIYHFRPPCLRSS